MRSFKLVWPAAAVGMAMVLGACGGGGSGSGSLGASAGSSAPSDAPTPPSSTVGGSSGNGANSSRGPGINDPAVQQCLASKGITLPARNGGEQPPQGSTRPTIDDATRQALADCGVTFGGGFGGRRGGNFNDPAFQQCLADKGVSLPAGAQRPQGETPSSVDQATRQAIQDCRAATGTTTTTTAAATTTG